MSSTNRLQVAHVRESTPGTTPTTPRMRLQRVMGEALTFTPQYVDPEEIRSDRMTVDPILVMKEAGGALPVEFSYPEDNFPLSDDIRSAMMSTWTNSPTFDNDGTADSVVTDAGTTTDTYVVASGGASVKAGHLVRATGFTNSANNQIFRAASSTATTIVGSSLSLTAETAPPGTAKLKVVGFQGASGDITATSGGLGSTALDFTTLGLSVGMWVKIGGTAAGDKFATAALNGWARITAIAATALTLDNKPSGWTTDAGTGKTIKVWFGDWIKNGLTQTTMTKEKAYLGQTTPVYLVYTGQQVNTFDLSVVSRQTARLSIGYLGMGGSESTTPLDASPDAVSTGRIMAANANCGRLADNGSVLQSPNWSREFSFQINNNLRYVEDVQSQSPQAVREGECTVTGRINTYFGDDTLLAKFYAGTASALNSRLEKDGQAVVFDFPRVTYRSDGNPSASGKNTDAMLPLGWRSSYDSTFTAHVIFNRIPYFES